LVDRLWRLLLILSVLLGGQGHARMAFMSAPAAPPTTTQTAAPHCVEAAAELPSADSAHGHLESTPAAWASDVGHPSGGCASTCQCAGSNCAPAIVTAARIGFELRPFETSPFALAHYGSPLLAPALRPPIA
jgi:hypothetical protein